MQGILFYVMCTPQNEDDHLYEIRFNLGLTISERLISTNEIKKAMTTAIMLMVEHELLHDGKNPSFSWLQTIYLEANYVEEKLKEI